MSWLVMPRSYNGRSGVPLMMSLSLMMDPLKSDSCSNRMCSSS